MRSWNSFVSILVSPENSNNSIAWAAYNLGGKDTINSSFADERLIRN